jgi:hypothetical protein
MRYRIMEANHPPKELFLKAYSRFYHSMKKKYLDGIERANNKAYARAFYFQTLFAENKSIPRYSVFFHFLTSIFNHYRKVDESSSLELTLARLSEMEERTSTIIEQTMIIRTTLSEKFYQLNGLYIQALKESHTSILELIVTEQRLLKYSEKKTLLLLALNKAVNELREEFSPWEEEIEQPLESKLTRSQQVLIFHYLSQSRGGKQKKNVSKCAAALHDFLGIPYTRITHSDLYKKMLRPLTFSSPKTTLQNLEIVRSFFEDWGLESIIKLIDLDIELLREKMK